MTPDEARRWLQENGKYPLRTREDEGRWYPESEGSLRHFGKTSETHCLLPSEVYYALDFPSPEGWTVEGDYPWFRPYEAAVEAAVRALCKVAVTLLDGGRTGE